MQQNEGAGLTLEVLLMSLCASTCLVSLLSCKELWFLFDGSAAQNFKAAAKAALRLSAHAVCKAH